MKVDQTKTGGNYTNAAIGQRQRAKSAVSQSEAKQETAVQSATEKPAYIVDIETSCPRPDSRQAVAATVTEDTSEDAAERFYQGYLEKRAAVDAIANDQLNTSELKMHFRSGSEYCADEFLLVRRIMEWGGVPGLKDEFLAQYEQYCNVEANIEKGGKETLLEYNLMFAGIAACANDEATAKRLNMFKEQGLYTQEEYDKAKNFAAILQAKSGVFVSAEFQCSDATGNDVRYSYMGALCSIGVDKLDFMAEHREADDIWINVAKAVYQNEADVVQALRDGGHDDIAEAYLNDAGYSGGNTIFEYQDGVLWDVTVGFTPTLNGRLNKEAFKELKNKYFGSETARVTYSAAQLQKAAQEGKKEYANLTDPPFLYLQLVEEEEDANKGSDRLDSLKQQIKELNQQIKEIKNSMLPEMRKNEMLKKFEQQMQTLQIQLNDVLASMARENKS